MAKVEILTDNFETTIHNNKIILAVELNDLRFLISKYKFELADDINEAYNSMHNFEDITQGVDLVKESKKRRG